MNKQRQQNYDDLCDLVNNVSNRTLEVKKENLKHLNTMGQELNELIYKAQQIVKSCTVRRNGKVQKSCYFYYFHFQHLYMSCLNSRLYQRGRIDTIRYPLPTHENRHRILKSKSRLQVIFFNQIWIP